jgi:hypothetical protein
MKEGRGMTRKYEGGHARVYEAYESDRDDDDDSVMFM